MAKIPGRPPGSCAAGAAPEAGPVPARPPPPSPKLVCAPQSRSAHLPCPCLTTERRLSRHCTSRTPSQSPASLTAFCKNGCPGLSLFPGVAPNPFSFHPSRISLPRRAGKQGTEQHPRVETDSLPRWLLVCDHLSPHKMMMVVVAKHCSNASVYRLM